MSLIARNKKFRARPNERRDSKGSSLLSSHEFSRGAIPTLPNKCSENIRNLGAGVGAHRGGFMLAIDALSSIQQHVVVTIVVVPFAVVAAAAAGGGAQAAADDDSETPAPDGASSD
eukprot:CAMPEP_0197434390 /NCGR_PEP_ID=MMETSP1175-20131217/2136_1 /TAXON_ID=1003142 /ORGANISM="Triceratium dubium, Strain CCMP147" /LENGTH=115 /DNA_ID=CAMNT_0042963097 /DNA_START=646 /DNA_END=994 /DNA_ORIENTATION=-